MKKIFLILLFLISTSCFAQQKPLAFWNSGFSQNASQYFARYDVKPTGDTLKWYAEFIDSLTLNGIWGKVDEMWVFANKTSANSLIGVKGYKNCTLTNSPAFSSYRGFTSNGTSSYINTNYTPGTHGVLMTTNSISFGCYSRKDTADNFPMMGLSTTTPSASVMYIYPKYTDNKFYYEPNTTSGTHGVTVSNSLGLMAANRNRSDSIQAYQRGVRVANIVVNSTFLITTFPILICTSNRIGGPNEFTKREVAFAWVGGSLTAQEQLNLYNCIQRLLTKIGANV